jgi:hypothetical protein
VAQNGLALRFGSDTMVLGGLTAHIKDLHHARTGFIKAFLFGLLDPNSSLARVFGRVDISNHMRLIASYAGVPVGAHWARVVRAARNMCF